MSLNKPKHILFILAQAGQAAFIAPILENWKSSKLSAHSYSLLPRDVALKHLDQGIIDSTSAIYSWDDLKDFTDQQGFDLVISSATKDNIEVEISWFCAKNSIPLIQFVDTFYDVEERLKASSNQESRPSLIWVLDDVIAKELDFKNITAAGHPVWEMALDKPKNVQKDRKVVFAAQPISEVFQLSDMLGYNEQIVWSHLCNIQKQYPDLISELIYAPHPAQKNLPELSGENCRFLNDNEDAILAGEYMVGMYSAILVEAHLRGQKVISFQPNLNCKNKDYLSYSGIIPLANNVDQCVEALRGVSLNSLGNLEKLLQGSCERCEASIVLHLNGDIND